MTDGRQHLNLTPTGNDGCFLMPPYRTNSYKEAFFMRKISNLLKVKGRVYLLSCTREDDRGLRVQATAENISIEGSTDLYIL